MRPRPARRNAFTLVELLVVMVLIAVLTALLLPAITGAMRTSKNAAVTSDINTLAQSLAAFKEKFGDYPPSRIMLAENGHYPLASTTAADMVVSGNGTTGTDISYGALMQRSLSYLRKFWPRAQFATGTTPLFPSGSTQWYDFDGNGLMATAPYILEGDECLAFFLGGIPLNTGTPIDPVWSMSGFGKVPTNPFSNNLNNGNPMYNGTRTPPMYEFKNDRLRDRDEPTKDAVRFPSYHDSLATDAPLAYFSAYGGEQYDPNDVNFAPLDAAGAPAGAEKDDGGNGPVLRRFRVTHPVKDSAGAAAAFAASVAPNPYHTSPANAPTTQWHKGQSFQIISPGADGLYGPGGTYTPAANTKMPVDPTTLMGTADATIRNREKDNLSNFSGGPLD